MPVTDMSSEIESEIPFDDDLPKVDGRRRLSFKKSFFVWTTQKQIANKNKFIFDSNPMIHSLTGKNSHHESYIIKSSKYETSLSSLNYDESDNEFTSESDFNIMGEDEKKDYYSMEELNNTTQIKNNYSKVRKVPQLSENTLCYSSNTNTINTVNTISSEFNPKTRLISANDIKNGLDGDILNIYKNRSKSNDNINEINIERNEDIIVENTTENIIENNRENIENVDGKNIENIENIYISDDEESDEYNKGDNVKKGIKYKGSSSSSSLTKNNKKTNKKTVTFCDNVTIIESSKPLKSTNIFIRIISKIIRRKQ
ncbi:hypothetical protein H8356DRAFT_1664261 [Neocallimastix lanati (nom. inval.)]|jgi:hypothetical protein|uniref:Uncharacterized protein n=1 Tax=Neocallimastix californiae TaxID=1754190 RepID=A0A1Y2DWV9_9FUNG|nr:hypothetical protein H8356DRAFT_1664261 [Neocallimastix sp. JGI-2020a]ORY63743.1 hypothetical protein LY90DRAFT_700909 [Neocallimastix californiae]|eukprot:ORY63743.1 hypothetical protein LY90DRAFT_700909 [Neocallimastix californiae]